MKKMLSTLAAPVMAILICLSGNALAGGSDTLVVYANGPTLDRVVNGDTTNTGQKIHSVYKLVSLDTAYISTAPIIARSSMTIVGVPGADGRPPCIMPGLLPDGSLPNTLCTVSGTGAKVTFKNVYFFGLGPNNSFNGTPVIAVTADSVKIYLDHVVASECRGDIIDYSGNHDSFFITNSKFRDGVWPNNWFASMVINAVYPTSPPVDTVIMKGNTILCFNSDAFFLGVEGPCKYVEVNHNTMVYNFQFAFQMWQVTNAVIENNIFYGLYAGSCKASQYHFFYYQPQVAPVSIIELDSLRWLAPLFDPADSSHPILAEAKRKVIVENNDYFQPQAIQNFWTQWNDTVSNKKDSLLPVMWMNPETQRMFSDDTVWPGFHEANNLVGVDPGYGPSITAIPTSAASGLVSLIDYIKEVRGGTITTDRWGYENQQVSGSNWIPQWPLPESADMKYTNSAVMNNSNDGLPLGDPSWFGKVLSVRQLVSTTPVKFDLSNNYPNPFNPSTTIKVSLNVSGVMSLKVYNVLGQLVKVVDEGFKPAGSYTYNVQMDNFPSGVYFYTLQQGSNVMTKKMLLVK